MELESAFIVLFCYSPDAPLGKLKYLRSEKTVLKGANQTHFILDLSHFYFSVYHPSQRAIGIVYIRFAHLIRIFQIQLYL